ncbi:MAG: polyamine aminopropyltransferase [Candidatus Gastranaerophilales bacterium]|nr:polyamine aminopropyltransferase [Candidatus Gastranaerophilales bacterium]
MTNCELRYTEMSETGLGISIEVNSTLYHGESDFQTIDIIDTKPLGRMLILDGLVMTSEKDEFFYHEMISHIPLNSHPNPGQVLVIGGGDGGTVREVLKHKSVERIVLCEIDGEVIEVCKKYLPTIAGELDNPKVELQIRDGVEYIKSQKDQFDIILIDSTDPLGPGVGLFTEDFYTNVKLALKKGGIMAAQSESPFADKKEIRLMYPLLKKVFPIVKTFVGPIPAYPGGYWSWAFCSVDSEPLSYINEANADEVSKSCKLYNKDLHSSAFVLPNFVKELVEKC